jgi:hypothetical protein
MGHVKPLSETPDSVTLSRADFEAMIAEIEDAEDRVAALEDCLLDAQPEQSHYLLTMAETMRIIDGQSPTKVRREKRGMTVAALAVAVGLAEEELSGAENGVVTKGFILERIAAALELPPDALTIQLPET